MRDDELENSRRFEQTQWDRVTRAAAGDPAALTQIYTWCRLPLISWLRGRFGFSLEKAEDAFQAFFLKKIIQGRLLARANPQRGKLRNLLITAIRNYTRDSLRREREMSPLDNPGPERLAAGPTETEVLGDVARLRLDRALRRTRAHYRRTGRARMWKLFKARILDPILNDAKPVPYEELIKRFGFKSPQEAFNALMDAKRSFKRFWNESAEDFDG